MSTQAREAAIYVAGGFGLAVVGVAVCLYGLLETFPCGSKVDTTQLQIQEVNKRVELYALKKGVPSSEDGLAAVFGNEDPPRDSWGRPFLYVGDPRSGFYDIVSLGRDGIPGGTGLDEDIRVERGRRQW